MGMGFQFEQHRLGLWDLSWDLKKTISWEMGLGPPLHDPHQTMTDNGQGIALGKVVLRSAHTMGLVRATSPCNKSQGLVASCELATSPCD